MSAEDGTEERSYPYSNIFAHVVGYDTNGKSGLESEANFQLLTSHEFFLNQIRNEFMGAEKYRGYGRLYFECRSADNGI